MDLIDAVLTGARETLRVGAAAAVVAVAAGVLAGVGRLSSFRLVRTVSRVYIEVFRGTPALVQLFFAAYVLPRVGVDLPVFVAAFIVLGLNVGSYGAEVVRGAVQAVPSGQREAAIVLGMSPMVATRRVIFPQALLAMVPPWTNLMIDLLKTTAFVSLVGLADITFQAQSLRVSSAGADTVAVFAIAVVLYVLFAQIIAYVGRVLERRLSHGRDVGVYVTESAA
jgi:polar amino acid transport system permease protein